MPRYAALEHREDGPRTPVPMFVYDEQEPHAYLGPKFTRAEAGIIEFSLNAISKGMSLVAIAPDCTALQACRVDGHVLDYEGPTDGVRKEAGV